MEKEITVIEAFDLMQGDKPLQLLDVRTPAEFEKKSIDGFVNIPFAEISNVMASLDGKKRTLILCADGSKSHQALLLLEACGYTAQVIRGGLKDWEKVIEPVLSQ